jgi:hypothetical protein
VVDGAARVELLLSPSPKDVSVLEEGITFNFTSEDEIKMFA